MRKLRYRPGMRVGIYGAPAGFEAELATADDLVRLGPKGNRLDLIQAFFTRRAHLIRALPRLKKLLVPSGILWIAYPKAKALGTNLDRDVVRTTAAGSGLQTVAIVAIDDVWSALRLKSSNLSAHVAK